MIAASIFRWLKQHEIRFKKNERQMMMVATASAIYPAPTESDISSPASAISPAASAAAAAVVGRRFLEGDDRRIWEGDGWFDLMGLNIYIVGVNDIGLFCKPKWAY